MITYARSSVHELPILLAPDVIAAEIVDALKARIKDAQTTQIHLADAIVEQAVAA